MHYGTIVRIYKIKGLFIDSLNNIRVFHLQIPFRSLVLFQKLEL